MSQKKKHQTFFAHPNMNLMVWYHKFAWIRVMNLPEHLISKKHLTFFNVFSCDWFNVWHKNSMIVLWTSRNTQKSSRINFPSLYGTTHLEYFPNLKLSAYFGVHSSRKILSSSNRLSSYAWRSVFPVVSLILTLKSKKKM